VRSMHRWMIPALSTRVPSQSNNANIMVQAGFWAVGG
jgi:hypothetical protein